MSKKFHWVIDPAHGELTKNRHSPLFTDNTVYHEYEFTHSVASMLCEKMGRNCSLTRTTPIGVGNSLGARVRVANSYRTHLPKYLLSIHSNLGSSGLWQEEGGGVEVWCPPDSTTGTAIGGELLNRISINHGLQNRGLKWKVNNPYYLMQNCDMPVLVLEIGFLDNPREVSLLMDPGYQESLAATIAGGLP
jgi:N-acetylmuramoyl-L-alanine amidase